MVGQARAGLAGQALGLGEEQAPDAAAAAPSATTRSVTAPWRPLSVT